MFIVATLHSLSNTYHREFSTNQKVTGVLELAGIIGVTVLALLIIANNSGLFSVPGLNSLSNHSSAIMLGSAGPLLILDLVTIIVFQKVMESRAAKLKEIGKKAKSALAIERNKELENERKDYEETIDLNNRTITALKQKIQELKTASTEKEKKASEDLQRRYNELEERYNSLNPVKVQFKLDTLNQQKEQDLVTIERGNKKIAELEKGIEKLEQEKEALTQRIKELERGEEGLLPQAVIKGLGLDEDEIPIPGAANPAILNQQLLEKTEEAQQLHQTITTLKEEAEIACERISNLLSQVERLTQEKKNSDVPAMTAEASEELDGMLNRTETYYAGKLRFLEMVVKDIKIYLTDQDLKLTGFDSENAGIFVTISETMREYFLSLRDFIYEGKSEDRTTRLNACIASFEKNIKDVDISRGEETAQEKRTSLLDQLKQGKAQEVKFA